MQFPFFSRFTICAHTYYAGAGLLHTSIENSSLATLSLAAQKCLEKEIKVISNQLD